MSQEQQGDPPDPGTDQGREVGQPEVKAELPETPEQRDEEEATGEAEGESRSLDRKYTEQHELMEAVAAEKELEREMLTQQAEAMATVNQENEELQRAAENQKIQEDAKTKQIEEEAAEQALREIEKEEKEEPLAQKQNEDSDSERKTEEEEEETEEVARNSESDPIVIEEGQYNPFDEKRMEMEQKIEKEKRLLEEKELPDHPPEDNYDDTVDSEVEPTTELELDRDRRGRLTVCVINADIDAWKDNSQTMKVMERAFGIVKARLSKQSLSKQDVRRKWEFESKLDEIDYRPEIRGVALYFRRGVRKAEVRKWIEDFRVTEPGVRKKDGGRIRLYGFMADTRAFRVMGKGLAYCLTKKERDEYVDQSYVVFLNNLSDEDCDLSAVFDTLMEWGIKCTDLGINEEVGRVRVEMMEQRSFLRLILMREFRIGRSVATVSLEELEVDEEELRINQCMNCYSFDHNRSNCGAGECCRQCGKMGHRAGQCRLPPFCQNCRSEGHTALSEECPVKRERKMVLRRNIIEFRLREEAERMDQIAETATKEEKELFATLRRVQWEDHCLDTGEPRRFEEVPFEKRVIKHEECESSEEVKMEPVDRRQLELRSLDTAEQRQFGHREKRKRKDKGGDWAAEVLNKPVEHWLRSSENKPESIEMKRKKIPKKGRVKKSAMDTESSESSEMEESDSTGSEDNDDSIASRVRKRRRNVMMDRVRVKEPERRVSGRKRKSSLESSKHEHKMKASPILAGRRVSVRGRDTRTKQKVRRMRDEDLYE